MFAKKLIFLSIRRLLTCIMPRRFARRTRPRRRRRRRPRRRRMRRSRMVLDPERKVVSQSSGANFISLNTTGITQLINGAPQGVEQFARQGFQSFTVSSTIAYRLQVGANTSNPQSVKVALVLFKQPRGVVLQVPEVWEAIGSDLSVLGLRDLNSVLNYRVIWSRVHCLNIFDASNVYRVVHRKHRIRTRYTGPAATFQDISTGALYFVAFSDTNLAADQPQLRFVTRARFVG